MRKNILIIPLTMIFFSCIFAMTGMSAAQNSGGASMQKNWFVILSSFPKAQFAEAEKNISYLKKYGYNAHYIDTNEYSNLKNGLWAVVMGPYSKKYAQEMKNKITPLVSDCYVKPAFKDSHTVNDDFSSSYTTLKWDDCRTIASSAWEPDAEMDSFEQECPAFNGYQIFLEGGDSRSWLVIRNDRLTFSLQQAVTENASGCFPVISENSLEWRYKKRGRESQLYSLIFEVDSQDKTDANKSISQWFVLRVEKEKICMLGAYFSPDEARSAADSHLKCRR